MFYIGIDVSKAKLDCCLLLDGERKRPKKVANTHKGINALLQWVQRICSVPVTDMHFVMEGTGVYHRLAAHALHDAGALVSVANPAQVRDFAKALGIRTKNDIVDSYALARYAQTVQPKAWQPAPQHVRVLEALIARRDAVAQDLQREKNRWEKAQVANEHQSILNSIDKSIAFLTKELKELDKRIEAHIDNHPDLKGSNMLLRSVPGVGSETSKEMLRLLHGRQFTSAEQLAAYVGVVPVERQSGTFKGRSRLSKAGSARVRAKLFMAAVVSTLYNPHIKAMYERLLEKGKRKMVALGAAMRKLVHLCFGVWKSQKPYAADYTHAQQMKKA